MTIFEKARTAVRPLLPLLTDSEREFVNLAAERSPVHLQMRLTDWAAHHGDAAVRAAAQTALNEMA